jgi:hypothetical protein
VVGGIARGGKITRKTKSTNVSGENVASISRIGEQAKQETSVEQVMFLRKVF